MFGLILVRRMQRIGIAMLLCSVCVADSLARLSRSWSHEELLAESDFVALIEPMANQPTKDVFTIEVEGGRKIKYSGIDTRFRINAVFKSDGKTAKEITVLHFSDEDAEPVTNGPIFIYFPIGPLEYEKRLLKDGKEIAKMTVKQGEPLLLAFLKRRDDGRYEPVSGQEDPSDSFYEMHSPFFPMQP